MGSNVFCCPRSGLGEFPITTVLPANSSKMPLFPWMTCDRWGLSSIFGCKSAIPWAFWRSLWLTGGARIPPTLRGGMGKLDLCWLTCQGGIG